MIKYHVIDGFVDDEVSDRLQGFFLGDSVNWNYNPFTTRVGRLYSGALECSNVIETYQFTSSLVRDDQIVSSQIEYAELARSILDSVSIKTELRVESIHRLKANMLMQGDYRDYQHHPPHYDTVSPNHWSMIYYLNRSDGPTRLFNKSVTSDFQSASDANDSYRGMECVDTINPVKNRAVIFPSNLLHASACPIQFSRRLVLNFVFSIKT